MDMLTYLKLVGHFEAGQRHLISGESENMTPTPGVIELRCLPEGLD